EFIPKKFTTKTQRTQRKKTYLILVFLCVLSVFAVNSLIMPEFLPLSDQAAMAYFPDEQAALNFAAAVRRAKPDWLVDVVQAYKSVAVFFDLDRIAFAQASLQLQELIAAEPSPASATEARRLTASASQAAAEEREPVAHRIPCCYELQLDLSRVA